MDAVAVILNPTSGRGRAGAKQEALRRALAAAGLHAEFFPTTKPAHAAQLALEAKQAGFPVVAAAGGDGTVSEVVNGLMRARRPDEPAGILALLPFGSGNDFAAHLRVPPALDGAIEALARGHVQRIDVGRVVFQEGAHRETRYFNNGMGLGLEAAVTLASYEIHRLQGLLLYLAAALKTLPRFQAVHVDLRAGLEDGRTWQRQASMLMVTIGNSPRSGGGFYLTPGARVDDGVLDVAVAAAVPMHRILYLLPKALRGKHTTDPAVTMLRVQTMQIRALAGIPMQLDGEVIARAATQVDVAVLPASLDVIVPM